MNRQENAGGGGGMFILLGVGLLAFWYISKGGLSSILGTTTTTPTTGTTTTPTQTGGTTTQTPPAPAYNSIAAIYQRILSASGNSLTQTLSPDQWNYYLVTNSSIPAGPDPNAVFGGHDPITLSAYWSGMQSWLTGQGLSGLSGRGAWRMWAA